MTRIQLSRLAAPLGASAAALLVSTLLASSAGAAVRLGHTCISGVVGAPPVTALVQTASAAGFPSYAVPAGGGVITGWETLYPAAPPSPFSYKLKVFRPSGAPASFFVVGESPGTIAGVGTATFAARIPVQAGDLLGAWASASAVGCMGMPPGYVVGGFVASDPAPGTVATTDTSSPPGYSVSIVASLEPDVDGDGFGDESQDACPTSAATQGACPPVVAKDSSAPRATASGLRGQDVLAQGAVFVVVRSNEPGTASATGSISVPGASKVFKLRRDSSPLTANARTLLELKLSRKARTAAKRALRHGKKLRAKVRVSALDAAGNRSTVRRTVPVTARRAGRGS